MKNIVIHFVLSSEDETVYNDFQEIIKNFDIHFEKLSFSPVRPYARMNDHCEGNITCTIHGDDFEKFKQLLADHFDECEEDEFETYSIWSKMCHSNLYYLSIQVI